MDLDQSSIQQISLHKLPWESGRDSLHSLSDITLRKDSSQSGLPKIYTVAQTLKDPFILSHIKPDYGSLGQFMGDVGLSKDLLMQKKKKLQTHEQSEQKRIKNILKSKKPEQILRETKSTAAQKRIASKAIVESLFQSKFGMNIQTFYNQNIKQDSTKKTNINIAGLEDLMNSMIDPQAKKSSHNIYEQLNQDNSNQKIRKLSQNMSVATKIDVNYKISQLNKIRMQYHSLKRVNLSETNEQYEKLNKKIEQQQKDDRMTLSIRTSRQKIHVSESIKKENHTVINNQLDFVLQNLNKVKSQTYLHFIYASHIQSIKQAKLIKLRMPQDVICFYLDAISHLATNLQQLTISSIAIEDPTRFCQKMAIFLESSPKIRRVSLNYLDIGTKQFCLICLGLGKNKSIQEISFKDNNIDNDCQSALLMILKFCPQLQKINLSRNLLTSTLKTLIKDERVVFKDP